MTVYKKYCEQLDKREEAKESHVKMIMQEFMPYFANHLGCTEDKLNLNLELWRSGPWPSNMQTTYKGMLDLKIDSGKYSTYVSLKDIFFKFDLLAEYEHQIIITYCGVSGSLRGDSESLFRHMYHMFEQGIFAPMG